MVRRTRACDIVGFALLVGLVQPAAATVVVTFDGRPLTNPAQFLPPPEAKNESPRAPHRGDARLCEHLLREQKPRRNYIFEAPLYTRSAKWGDVVRIDFHPKGTPPDPDHYHRLVCFVRDGFVNFNAGVYDGTLKDPAGRLWFTGEILRLDPKF